MAEEDNYGRLRKELIALVENSQNEGLHKHLAFLERLAELELEALKSYDDFSPSQQSKIDFYLRHTKGFLDNKIDVMRARDFLSYLSNRP